MLVIILLWLGCVLPAGNKLNRNSTLQMSAEVPRILVKGKHSSGIMYLKNKKKKQPWNVINDRTLLSCNSVFLKQLMTRLP